MKQITESKLYKMAELESLIYDDNGKRAVHIAAGVNATIFDREDIIEKVTFGQGATLKYFGYFSEEKSYDKLFQIVGEENRCEVYALISSKGENIVTKLYGELASSHSYLDMHIVSFVSENGLIDLDGVVHITKGIEKVEGYLDEKNIFLGSSGKVRGLPTLLVHSDDVKAAHACNMERISDDKLFYLRSRGLPKEDATVLMLESYIAKIFSELKTHDEELYEHIKQSILDRIR